MRRSKSSKVLAFAVVAALAAAACGSDDGNGSTPDPGVTVDDGDTGDDGDIDDGDDDGDPDDGDDGDGGNGGVPVPDGEFDQDATFVYAYQITVSRLDPHRASISQDGTTLFPAYDRLVHLAPNGEFIPGLAESWEFSEDGLTLTMSLREGVTFHDGAPFDAEAVEINFDRAKSIEGSSVATDLGSIEDVTVVDEFTVELTLSEPNVAVIGSLSDRAGIQVSPQAIADGVNLDEEMVGAGPYRMVSHTPGATTLFERNDDYWDTENIPNVARLEIRVIADNVARLNAFRTGQVDATTIGANQVSEVDDDPEVQVLLNTELQYIYLVQNRSRANQDDVRVRQAIVHAIDREAICDALIFGYCELTDQPFPPGYFAYDDSIPDVLYDYDLDRSRELLEEAGVGNFDISLIIPAGLATYPEVAETVQAMLTDVGITVEIQAAEPTQLGELMFAQQVTDMMLAAWGGRPDPAITMIQRASETGFANPGGVTTERMTELIEQAVSTTDADERTAVLRQGSREMAESVLEIVLYFPQVPYVLGDGVYFEPYQTAKPEFRNVGKTG